MDYWRADLQPGIPVSSLAVTGPAAEAGDGYDAVYVISVEGVSPSIVIEPVILLDSGVFADVTASVLLAKLQASPSSFDEAVFESNSFLSAEAETAKKAASLRNEREKLARRRNDAQIAARKTSIESSFQAKLRRTNELLSDASDPRIQRMRSSQLENLEIRLQNKLAELESAREISVSSRLIAGGRIRILPSSPSS